LTATSINPSFRFDIFPKLRPSLNFPMCSGELITIAQSA
jgi:hypothetical protein